jgi:hypothetical protein
MPKRRARRELYPFRSCAGAASTGFQDRGERRAGGDLNSAPGLEAPVFSTPRGPGGTPFGISPTRLPQIWALVERFCAYAGTTRQAIDTVEEYKDMSTSDLFTELSRAVDKNLWFLESHLQA